MKKRVWNLCGIAILAGVIGFSLIQLTTPVVRAQGCPAQAYIDGCNCQFQGGYVEYDPVTHWHCFYRCTCAPSGGGEPFEIEREVDVYP